MGTTRVFAPFVTSMPRIVTTHIGLNEWTKIVGKTSVEELVAELDWQPMQ